MMNETKYTFDERIVSDLYKEAYGSRPRADFWAKWDKGTADEKQMVWDFLIAEAESEAERERQEQLAVERHLERIVIPNIQSYLNDCSREDAIRHLHDTYDTNDSLEYLEYTLGVRYGYLSGSVKVGF
jgi:hypothetical protein